MALDDGGFTVLPPGLGTVIVAAQLLWTAAIAGHLVYAFLSRRDEKPLLAALDRSYGPTGRPAD